MTIWGNYEDEDNREIEKAFKINLLLATFDELEKEKGKEKRKIKGNMHILNY